MTVCQTRSAMKGVTWRVIASVTTAVLVYAFTGSLELTAGISVFDISLKSLLYHMHERGWNMVNWGRAPDATPSAPIGGPSPVAA